MSNNTNTSNIPARDPNKYIVNDLPNTNKSQSPTSNNSNVNSTQPKTPSSGNANGRPKPRSIGHYILGKYGALTSELKITRKDNR